MWHWASFQETCLMPLKNTVTCFTGVVNLSYQFGQVTDIIIKRQVDPNFESKAWNHTEHPSDVFFSSLVLTNKILYNETHDNHS